MEPEIQCKIEQTVLDILKNADMESMTEFKVRLTASERLGIDLTDIPSKKIIRGVVESFLLSNVEKAGEECDANSNLHGAHQFVAGEGKEAMRKEFDGQGNRVICKLSKKRNVVILQDFKGKSSVSIREFFCKDGKQIATSKGNAIHDFRDSSTLETPHPQGINLNAEQWSTFRMSIPLIEEAILKMQSKSRSNTLKENEQISNLATTSTCQTLNGKIPKTAAPNGTNGHVPKLVNAAMPPEPNTQDSDKMATSTRHELNGEICDSAVAPTHELLPIEIKRFNGKDYNSWAPKMEAFLKQLKVAHVLTDPCPSRSTRMEANLQDIPRAKAAEQKWFNDDYMCRHNILAFLSDALYKRYSSTKSAKELWEELRLVYLHEEFGKKRSQVKSYIEFQIADEKPILEQVHKLNSIADSIVASGIHFDEKFHISTLIAKLPPSWRDLSMKLLCEEHLPFWKLMDRIRMEEEARNHDSLVEPPGYSRNPGTRTNDVNKQRFSWKRQETDMDNRALGCYFCGKRGHLSKDCRNKKADNRN